jgi:hypothetical protein
MGRAGRGLVNRKKRGVDLRVDEPDPKQPLTLYESEPMHPLFGQWFKASRTRVPVRDLRGLARHTPLVEGIGKTL